MAQMILDMIGGMCALYTLLEQMFRLRIRFQNGKPVGLIVILNYNGDKKKFSELNTEHL